MSEADRVELTEFSKNPGTGVLKQLEAGLNPTLYDLAVLMIIVSDNTATDLLLDILGRTNVNQTMANLGLTKTRVDLTCRDILFDLVGIDSANPSLQDVKEAHRRRERGEVNRKARTMVDLACNNVSAAREMTDLLWRLAHGKILGPRATSRALDVLERQQVNDRLPLFLPTSVKVAHKTGELPGIKNDAGLVYDASRKRGFAVTVFNWELDDEMEGRVVIGKAALIAARHFLQC